MNGVDNGVNNDKISFKSRGIDRSELRDKHMSSNYIQNPHKVLPAEDLKPLRTFAMRKDAVAWCKANSVKPARIVKLKTKWQYSYALDMGVNCFLVDDDMVKALSDNDNGIYNTL